MWDPYKLYLNLGFQESSSAISCFPFLHPASVPYSGDFINCFGRIRCSTNYKVKCIQPDLFKIKCIELDSIKLKKIKIKFNF